MARMEIVKPEALRVTPAHKAFKQCARALRSEEDHDFYGESSMSEQISCFWSHSWHGSRWMKILSLMVRYNGLPAVLVGSFTAVTMIILFIFGLLPGFSRYADNAPRWSTWSLTSGFAATVITFFVWRPQQLVFLDRICINGDDLELKTVSIFSLAGILKRSDHMLVLWDPTWSERLWCVFELAAFLKSKAPSGAGEQVLLIRPTFLGPCSIGLFIGVFLVFVPATTIPMRDRDSLGAYLILVPLSGVFLFLFIMGYVLAAAFRAYFRSVETLKENMRKISFDNARCSCCDQDHVQGGARMMCDRKVVKKCVSIWFGSEEAFEDYARSEVLETLLTGLHDQIFTRGWSLSVAIPILWAFLDLAVSEAVAEAKYSSIALSIHGLVLWFCCAPIFVDVCTFFAWRYCRANTWFGEVLENLRVELVGVVCFCAISGSWVISMTFDWEMRVGAFAGLWCMLALFHVLYKVSRKSGGCHPFRQSG